MSCEIPFDSKANIFGAITLNANVSITSVKEFDPQPLKNIVDDPNRDEFYAKRFEAFDPELGRLIRQIHQIISRTTSHPMKSTASDVRQAYDHLIRKLVPNDENVRMQTWWIPNPKNKDPNQVERGQRYRYAVEKHVDGSEREVLLASMNHAMKIYNHLNKLLHTEKPIDTKEAKETIRTMLEVLYKWADALEI